tara:strand:+ start:83 stop:1312 length:1230 start_codon:yes stop_codon:yes gene_type:complete
MPKIVEKANWISVFRQQLKEFLPEGEQWFVTNCKGKVRLQVKEEEKVQTRILPYDWTVKDSSDALQRIKEIHNNYHALEGTKTLKKACEVVQASSSRNKLDAEELLAEFREYVPNAGDETWKKCYLPVLNNALTLLARKKNKPADGYRLMMDSLMQWPNGQRMRQIQRRSLKKFLEWSILNGKLPAAYAPPAIIPETRNKKKVGYPLSDSQILLLLEEEKDEKWRFAFQLMSVYGLRPEELRYLVVKEGVKDYELHCTYEKSMGGNKGDKTDPRRLHPLFVKDAEGNPIDWNLQNRLKIGEPLPYLGDDSFTDKGNKRSGKAAMHIRTRLRRRNSWNSFREIAEKQKENLTAYGFRHRYAKQSHAMGFPIANIAEAMGHSPEVHLDNYARFKTDNLEDMYNKANQLVNQ